MYQVYTRIQAITHTCILHITGFILKHGTGCIRNHNRDVRLTYSFHTSCSDLAVNDKEKIEKALRLLDKLEGYADSLASTRGTISFSNLNPSFKRYFQRIKKILES